MKKIIFAIFLVLSTITSINGSEINDAAALNGIKKAKSVFLIDFTNPGKTAFYMEIIEGTYAGFKKQGVEPDMVLVFIGKTVEFLSTKQDETFAFEYENELNRIQKSIKNFSKLGVRMEVCAVATKVFKIDNDTIPKEMDIIADGFISLIGWQTQGHKLVPIF